MHHIKPLSRATREDVRHLAHAAADRGETLDTANVFPAGSANHDHFLTDYLERNRALTEVD